MKSEKRIREAIKEQYKQELIDGYSISEQQSMRFQIIKTLEWVLE